ncbi:S-layer homology domain-containing protein [Sporomusa sp.]|uniref:S-layer homology domain-containing protein n=1 Tax=Sporomusa sp. TaxID=2078658 RepID=UPI002BD56321|nr:S-layer homology domain-containing protein [Sporomusa sp.]HWR06570.1 S-layer homology domain-containing protein [Sporomusa sp.]
MLLVDDDNCFEYNRHIYGGINRNFQRCSPNHWAYETLNKLAKDGIIQGYNDGTPRTRLKG